MSKSDINPKTPHKPASAAEREVAAGLVVLDLARSIS